MEMNPSSFLWFSSPAAKWDEAIYVGSDGLAVTGKSADYLGVKGQLGITTIQFSEKNARFLRVTQSGSKPTYHWSIYEFRVFKGKR